MGWTMPATRVSGPMSTVSAHTPRAAIATRRSRSGTSIIKAGSRRWDSSGPRRTRGQWVARIDTWVRDIRQVIDDAIAKAQPKHGQVVLVGYSAGGQRVGRTLYPDNPVLPPGPDDLAKVSRVVFISSIFNLPVPAPTEETEPPIGFPTFPLDLDSFAGAGVLVPATREAFCTGRTIAGSTEQQWEQTMDEDELGSTWGGNDPERPTRLNRSPTYSVYGWNNHVAGTLTLPTLVIHGVDDRTSLPVNSTDIFKALPASMASKVLVQVDCAGHGLMWEGCTGARCDDGDPDTRPYGVSKPHGRASNVWAGPHATVKGALIEWITKGTFNGAENGCFLVNPSGVANPAPCPTP